MPTDYEMSGFGTGILTENLIIKYKKSINIIIRFIILFIYVIIYYFELLYLLAHTLGSLGPSKITLQLLYRKDQICHLVLLQVYIRCFCAVEGQFFFYKVDLCFLPLTTEALSVYIASCRKTCQSRIVVFKLISLVQAVSRFTMLESSVICYCASAACGPIKPLLHTHLCRYKLSQSNPSPSSAKL